MRSRIAELWREHRAARFPSGYQGEEVAGFDLILLDADSAGCVSAFLSRGGRLDPALLAVLGLCYHHLAIVAAQLRDEAQQYFGRLEELAGLVLAEVRDGAGTD